MFVVCLKLCFCVYCFLRRGLDNRGFGGSLSIIGSFGVVLMFVCCRDKDFFSYVYCLVLFDFDDIF